MIRKIWYGMLVLVTVYLEIMYDSTWLISLLAFEILLAAALYLMSWYFRYNGLAGHERSGSTEKRKL